MGKPGRGETGNETFRCFSGSTYAVKLKVFCLSTASAFRGRPPLPRVKRRRVCCSSACTNSAAPQGRPEYVQHRKSVIAASLPCSARKLCQLAANHRSRHVSMSRQASGGTSGDIRDADDISYFSRAS